MDPSSDLYSLGLFDSKHRAFLETVKLLHPKLHHYCSRMTGSVLDGEDVVQEVLFEAYRKLDQYDESRALQPWLFGIAHNRCIDFLRKRGVQEEADEAASADIPESTSPIEPLGRSLGIAVERLVVQLPPKERACVLLKDVFDYSILEIADLVGSTPGGVKAALNRGRTKLATLPPETSEPVVAGSELSKLLQLYVDGFNRRDWSGVRDLISADAQLLFANGYAGKVRDSEYFGKYETSPIIWRMAAGTVDGEPVVIIMQQEADGWKSKSVIRLEMVGGEVVRVTDYLFCPWVLLAAKSVVVGATS